MSQYLQHYRRAVESLNLSRKLVAFPESLLMRRQGDWASYYAPFEHVNQRARIALVGLTPGLQQAENAWRTLQAALRRGTPEAQALEIAKQTASFSGPLRSRLVAILDTIGLHTWLGISTTAELFGVCAHLVHYTSAFRFPVTLGGRNYAGNRSLRAHAFLRDELARGFNQELREVPDDLIFLPLGAGATEALEWLIREQIIPAEHVLSGLPHPSTRNMERVAYFTGAKARERCSKKVDTASLDHRRADLIRRVRALGNSWTPSEPGLRHQST